MNGVKSYLKRFLPMPHKNLSQVLQNNRDENMHMLEQIYGQNEELIWAEIFNSTISDSSWLINKSFAPGRAAVGFSALYAIYRILNETHPKNTLEIGLGQTTHLISQYAAYYKDVRHTVIEHDQSWIDFYCNSKSAAELASTKIERLNLTMAEHSGKIVRKYEGFAEAIKGSQYDFLCIDGPFGYDMKEYARVDVLESMPNCLGPSFVIALDDCQRACERATFAEMEQLLQSHAVQYAKGAYGGCKNFWLLCNAEQKFLCTM